MKRFLRKLFKRKPKYEPAGIVHFGIAAHKDAQKKRQDGLYAP